MKVIGGVVAVLAVSCSSNTRTDKAGDGSGTATGIASGSGQGSGAATRKRNEIGRAELNRLAVRLNLPVYWIADLNRDKSVDPDEVAPLLFYPPFEGDLDAAYDQILALKAEPLPDTSIPEGKRRKLVGDDLDNGRATLVLNDLTTLSAGDKAFVNHMLAVAARIDEIYTIQNGSAPLAELLPRDKESVSLFRRNRGPTCITPGVENDPACSALRGAPKPIVDVYPATVDGTAQADKTFCDKLGKRPDAAALMTPFTAVRDVGGKLTAVAYSEAYKEPMVAIAGELVAAAKQLDPATEPALVAYLRAAAASFETNDWVPADEAWAAMNADNSKWYVRVGPDETYWEPCGQKAGFHLTFARINQGSKQWQEKLVPVQQDLEAAIAARAGAPYKAREVSFHLPDFIDIVINAGDDRDGISATIGQSLPNWGPVPEQGRGRTVVMANLYTDDDSLAMFRNRAESVLDAASMKRYVDAAEPGLVATILHEATHNFGPAHEYKVKGKKGPEVFGGPMAQVMEELKAQTGAMFLLEVLRGKSVISDELAAQTYTDELVWVFGHIGEGMYTGDGQRKTYSQLAAIQLGFLIDAGAITWDAKAAAANGKDIGAFTIHADKLAPAADQLMNLVGGIKARGDKRAADALAKKYVDGTVVPHAVIVERMNRYPKASFVYSIEL